MTPTRMSELRLLADAGVLTVIELELLDELAAYRQAIWDIDAILGFDHDGDPGPDAMVFPDLIEMGLRDAREFRQEYDELLDEVKL